MYGFCNTDEISVSCAYVKVLISNLGSQVPCCGASFLLLAVCVRLRGEAADHKLYL